MAEQMLRQFCNDLPENENLRQRAAAYVRMSTDHQQYSTSNQLDVIREYARQRNWEIVQEYSDEGKSGLTIKGRAALGRMINDAVGKNASFNHILVYDVSRWGRFQDPDEAAHYEFICREAGLSVHYCAEQFENDGGLNSTITKNLKRVMAGEFSRELSTKVFQGASRMIRMGYKQGGPAIYGLRRMLVDQNGQHKIILQAGEQKSLQTDRVIYVPGPEEEIKEVRWIFETFVHQRRGTATIANLLNQRGILSPSGCPWTGCKIRNLLHNEKYIGNLVYARRTSKLGSRDVINPPEQWIRREQAFPGIVARELFFQAQAIFKSNERRWKYTEEELLDELRVLLKEHGYLSRRLIDAASQTPQANTYRKRFGGLGVAFRRIGFIPDKNHHPEITGHMCKINREMISIIIRQIASLGATATWIGRHRTLVLNQELRVWVIFIRHNVAPCGTSFWFSKRVVRIKPDITMAVRMDRHNENIQDYYLLPGLGKSVTRLNLTEHNGVYLDAYRFQSLDFLVGMAARVKLMEAA